QGGPAAAVSDIATSQYPTKAVRPANSRLSTQKFRETFGWIPPEWQNSLSETVVRLLA
ncbi:MAG: NAD(P)-dependent oxidoreductase, partial [Brucellaceae bacterium]|nr:NAD(P)-dependent oxidoreductase [Brucellaceae bacterium]